MKSIKKIIENIDKLENDLKQNDSIDIDLLLDIGFAILRLQEIKDQCRKKNN